MSTCPRDTNGDGDCGRPICPHCGRQPCVFCAKIEAGEVDRLTEGSAVVHFEPLNPVVPGHRLFVHSIHTPDAAFSPSITGRVFAEASVWAAFSQVPFNLITSAGTAATQSVFHLHVHYVPRADGDGLMLPWSAH